MILFFLALDKHVVHIYLYVPSNLLIEHMVDQPLVHGSCVLQAVGHDPVAIKPLPGDEGDLLFIFFYHLNLVVSGEGVNKGEKLVSSC